MTNSKTIYKDRKKYDLEERTAKFGEEIIKFAKKIPRNTVTIPIINQLVYLFNSSLQLSLNSYDPPKYYF